MKPTAKRLPRESHALVTRVQRFIRRHEMLSPSDTVIVAVSGGPDSIALLNLLLELPQTWRLRLVICHLDHQLRAAESTRDAHFVARLAENLGLAAAVEQRDVAAMARQERIGLEEAGRKARYEFFEKTRIEYHATRVALGHTADDQVETVIHRFLRGSGLRGMSGMAAVRDSVFIRPLLGVWRSEIMQYLQDRKISYRLDASNSETVFVRNKIRLKLLPVIRDTIGPGVGKAIHRLATTAREDHECLETEALRRAKRILQCLPDGSLFCRVADLKALPAALRRRILLRALQMCCPTWDAWEYSHIEQLLSLMAPGRSGKSIQLPQHLRAIRQFDNLVLHRQIVNQPAPFEHILTIPGKLTSAEYQWELMAHPGAADLTGQGQAGGQSTAAVVMLENDISELQVRSFREGDRWRPDSHKKVKNSWNCYKVPQLLRSRIPLVFGGGKLLWIPGLPLPSKFPVGKADGVRLEFRFNPATSLGYWLQEVLRNRNCGAQNPLI